MTVPSDRSKAGPFDGDGNNTAFPFDFNIPSAAEVEVVKTLSTGEDVTLNPVLYSIDQASLNSDSGGVLIYPTSGPVLATGEKLTILRSPLFLQGVDLKGQSNYSPADVEGMSDKSTWQTQWLRERQQRTLLASVALQGFDFTLPYRAGWVFGWHAADKRVELFPSSTTTLEEIASLKTSTVKYRDDIGLKGDGTSDDSVALQKAMSDAATSGGGVFMLEPLPNKTFYLRYGISVPSGVQLFNSGGGFSGSKGAFVRIAGDVDTTPKQNLYRLTANAVAGAATLFIDTGPQGGGAVSAHFPIGTRIVVYGRTDGCGNTLTRDELRVTASDATSVALSQPLTFDYPIIHSSSSYTVETGLPDYTYIAKAVQGALALDAPEGVNTVTLSPGLVGQFAIDDYVIIESDKRCADIVSGASTERTHVEIRQVIDINGDGANSLTLNGYLERTYETAYGARVTRLAPASRAMVQGAAFTFTEAPDPSPAPQVHTFEMWRAVNCSMIDCEVSNEDAYGSRGAMFRDYQSYRCRWVAPDGRNPKSLMGLDGRGYVSAWSTECEIIAPNISGCRRNISFHGATLGRALAPLLGDDREGSLSFAGCYETGCVATEALITGGSRLAPGANDRSGVRLGDQTNRVGPYRCGAEVGRLANYRGPNFARGIQAFPGMFECFVRGQFDDIETLLYQGDTPGATALVANGLTIEGTVNGCVGSLVDVNGGRHGSATRTMQNLKMILRVYGAGKHVFLTQVAGAQLQLDIDQINIDATEPYIVKAVDVTGLEIVRSVIRGARSGISLQNCPGAVVMDCRFRDFSGGLVILQDNGGNTNAQWIFNVALGFVATQSVPGTPSTGFRRWPLAISATADFTVIP